jgi:hypothetical protein
MATRTKRIDRYKSRVRPLKANSAALENNHKWKRLSVDQREVYPNCYDPYLVHIPRLLPCTLRHHVIPANVATHLIYVWDNTRSLCAVCHNRVEADNDNGLNTRQLFTMSEDERVDYLLERMWSYLNRTRRAYS